MMPEISACRFLATEWFRRRFHGLHRVSRAASGSVHSGPLHFLKTAFKATNTGRVDLQQLSTIGHEHG